MVGEKAKEGGPLLTRERNFRPENGTNKIVRLARTTHPLVSRAHVYGSNGRNASGRKARLPLILRVSLLFGGMRESDSYFVPD